MAVASFPNLISGPSKLASSSATATLTTHPISSQSSVDPDKHFSISHLPFELRQLIYINHLQTLPPISITAFNAKSPLHSLTALSLASSFLTRDIPASTFYRHASFIFTSGSALKFFSEHFSRSEHVRRIKIVYGKDEFPTRDWVVLMNECFKSLEEVTFELERERYRLNFGNWWGCVRDAVREGLSTQQMEGGGVARRSKKRGLRLRVEDGEWGVCEFLR